ncbi:MAG: nucleotidyltransferase family protein [bacterium]|nr:nucleotidyltransferase family protein [bacterium]
MSDLTPRIPLDMEKIETFCKKWQIVEFSLFGSVLTDDFRPDSDVDVMVKFAEGANIGLFEWVDIEEELEEIVGRKIDLITRPSVERSENYLVQRSILAGTKTFNASGCQVTDSRRS